MAKQQMRQAEKQHEEELEALERAREEQAEQAARHAELLESQREAIEEAAIEARIAAAEAAEEHRRTTADAWKLQSRAKSERAYSLYQSGMMQEAYKLAVQSIDQDPGNFNGFWVVASSLVALHDTRGARPILEKQIQLLNLPEYRGSPSPFCSVLHLLSLESDLFLLRDAFSSALSRNVGAWRGHDVAGDALKLTDQLIQLNMLSDAQHVLEQVLQAPPCSEGTIDAASRLSQVFIAKGDTEGAMKVFDMLLRVDSESEAVLRSALTMSKAFLTRGDTGLAAKIVELLSTKPHGLLGEAFLQEMSAALGRNEAGRIDALIQRSSIGSRQKIEADISRINYFSERGELSKETLTSVMRSVCAKYDTWKSELEKQLRDRAAASAKTIEVKTAGGWIGVLSFVVLTVAAVEFCISRGVRPESTGAVFPFGTLFGAILIGTLYGRFRRRLRFAKEESSHLASSFNSENNGFANLHLPLLTPPSPGIGPRSFELAAYPAIVIVYLIGWFSMLAGYQPQQQVLSPVRAQQLKTSPGRQTPSLAALETGVVTTCAQARGWKNYVPKSEFSPGEVVCVYAEALNVNRGGHIDMTFSVQLTGRAGTLLTVPPQRFTLNSTDTSCEYTWGSLQLPAELDAGTHVARVEMRNNLTGQAGRGATTFIVLPNEAAISNAPMIVSVTPILPRPNQTITIAGNGFGYKAPFDGDSPSIIISDLTKFWNAGNTGDLVTLDVAEWTDTKIVIRGFTGSYGGSWNLSPGDEVRIQVWNAQTGKGPTTETTTVVSSK